MNLVSMLRRHTNLGSHWINQMEMDAIEEVQENCKEAMDLFGYQYMNDWTDNVAFQSTTNFSLSK